MLPDKIKFKKNNSRKHNRLFILIILIGFIIRLFLSIQAFSGDVNNHISWGKDFVNLGPGGIYERDFIIRYKTMTPTYPPVSLYLFAASYKLYSEIYNLSWKLNLSYRIFPSNFIFFMENGNTLPAFFKIWSIFSDIGIAITVYYFVGRILKNKNYKIMIFFSSLIIFNPGLIYNSSYWGQIDSLPLFFVLLSLYLLLFSDKKLLSFLFFTLALLSKQTSIIFIPIFALLYFRKLDLKKTFKGAIMSLFVFFTAFLPFYKNGNILLFPFTTYWNKIQTGSGSDYVTDHAFNLWSLITGLGKIHDSNIFIFMPFRWWGYLIFFTLFAIILVNLIIKKFNGKYVLFALSLIALSSFLFLTRMQSRYIIQAIPFLLLLGAYERKFISIFAFVSIYKFINMYHNWWAPRIDLLVNIFSKPAFINGISLMLLGIFVVILLQYLRKESPGYEQ
jgi:Gpi18-like mannosyltransferase